MRCVLFLLLLLPLLSPAIAQPGAAAPPAPAPLGYSPRRFTGATYALGEAIAQQNTGAIKRLMQQHPQWLNRPDSVYGQTPLTFAVWNGRRRAVSTLLDLGADPNLRDGYSGHTPLIAALDFQAEPSAELLGLLLARGADPNQVATPTAHTHFYTPLIAAAAAGSLPLMRQLVAAGASAQVPVPPGKGLLLQAAISQRPEVVYYCVAELHTDPTQQLLTTADGQPAFLINLMRNWVFPLGSARHQEKMKLVDYLKTQGIDYYSAPIPAWRAEGMTPDYKARY